MNLAGEKLGRARARIARIPDVETTEQSHDQHTITESLQSLSDSRARGDEGTFFQLFVLLSHQLDTIKIDCELEQFCSELFQQMSCLLEDPSACEVVIEILLKCMKRWSSFVQNFGSHHIEQFLCAHLTTASALLGLSELLKHSPPSENWATFLPIIFESQSDFEYENAKMVLFRRFLAKYDKFDMSLVLNVLSYLTQMKVSSDVAILWARAVQKAIRDIPYALSWLAQRNFFADLCGYANNPESAYIALQILATASGCESGNIDDQLYQLPLLVSVLTNFKDDDDVSTAALTIFVNFLANTHRQPSGDIHSVIEMLKLLLKSGSFCQKVRVMDIIHNMSSHEALVATYVDADLLQDYFNCVCDLDILREHPRYFVSLRRYVEIGLRFSGIDFRALVEYLESASHYVPKDGPAKCEAILSLINRD